MAEIDISIFARFHCKMRIYQQAQCNAIRLHFNRNHFEQHNYLFGGGLEPSLYLSISLYLYACGMLTHFSA